MVQNWIAGNLLSLRKFVSSLPSILLIVSIETPFNQQISEASIFIDLKIND